MANYKIRSDGFWAAAVEKVFDRKVLSSRFLWIYWLREIVLTYFRHVAWSPICRSGKYEGVWAHSTSLIGGQAIDWLANGLLEILEACKPE